MRRIDVVDQQGPLSTGAKEGRTQAGCTALGGGSSFMILRGKVRCGALKRHRDIKCAAVQSLNLIGFLTIFAKLAAPKAGM